MKAICYIQKVLGKTLDLKVLAKLKKIKEEEKQTNKNKNLLF